MAFIDQDLGSAGRIVFDTAGDAEEFLTTELEKWLPLGHIITRHPSMRDKAIAHQREHLERAISDAKLAPDHPKQGQRLKMWFEQYHEGKEGGRVLCSRIPQDAAALTLASSDPEAVTVGMAARQRTTDVLGSLNANDRAEAILSLQRFAQAGSEDSSQKISLDGVRQQTNKLIKGWEKEVKSAVSSIEDTIANLQVRLTEISSQRTEHAKLHDEMLTKHDNDVKETIKKYMTEMSLRAPVKYWSDLAKDAQGSAHRWLVLFGVLAVVLFVAIALYGPELISLLKDTNGTISIAAVPLLVAAMIPLFWVLKHIARMFADNLADARDAKQRASLTSTFLALSAKEAVIFSDAERAIIVQALFRPSPAQPSDDGVPVPLIELMKK